MTNILLFAYNYPPINSSGAVRPARFVKYLRRLDFEVDVITAPCDRPDSDSRSHHVPDAAAAKITQLRARFADFYQSVVSPYNERIPWSVYAADCAARLIRERPIRAILSTTPPVGTHIAAMAVRKRFGIPWISDFRDPVLGNPFRTAPRARPFYRRMEQAIARHSARIVVNTPAFLETMKERYPDCAAKMSVIPNGYDPEESFGPLPVPARSRKIIAHIGTLYGGRHPGLLLASFERLIARGALDPGSVRLECIGEANSLAVPIENFPRLLELGCVKCDGKLLPREQARQLTAEADGLLLIDLNEENTSLQVPAKAYDYVLVGRPILVLTRRGSPTGQIMAMSGVPNVVIDPFDSEPAIDEAVLRYLALPNTSTPPSAAFRRNHDGALQAAHLAELIRSVI